MAATSFPRTGSSSTGSQVDTSVGLSTNSSGSSSTLSRHLSGSNSTGPAPPPRSPKVPTRPLLGKTPVRPPMRRQAEEKPKSQMGFGDFEWNPDESPSPPPRSGSGEKPATSKSSFNNGTTGTAGAGSSSSASPPAATPASDSSSNEKSLGSPAPPTTSGTNSNGAMNPRGAGLLRNDANSNSSSSGTSRSSTGGSWSSQTSPSKGNDSTEKKTEIVKMSRFGAVEEVEVEYELLSFGDVEYRVPKRKQVAPAAPNNLSASSSGAASGNVSPGGPTLSSFLHNDAASSNSSADGDSSGDPLGASGSGSFRGRDSLVSALIDELDMPMLAKSMGHQEEEHLLEDEDEEDDEAAGGALEIQKVRSKSKVEIEPTSFGDFQFSLEDDDGSTGTGAKSGSGGGSATRRASAFAFGDFGAAIAPLGDIKQRKPSANPDAAAASMSGRLLADIPLIRQWNVETMIGHGGRIRGLVSCTADDDYIVSTGGDMKAPLGRRKQVNHIAAIYSAHKDIILHISVSSDGRFVATAGNDKTLCVHDTQTSKRISVMKHPASVTCSAFADNGRFVITGCHDGICRLYTTQGNGPLRTLTFSEDSIITCVALHPSGENAASGSSDGRVFMWKSASGSLLNLEKESAVRRHTVLQLSFVQKGTMLVSLDKTRLVFTQVPSGVTLYVLNSKTIDYESSRLQLRPAAGQGSPLGARKGLPPKGGGSHNNTTTAMDFHFTAFHFGRTDRMQCLPDGVVALGGNDRMVRLVDVTDTLHGMAKKAAELEQEKGKYDTAADFKVASKRRQSDLQTDQSPKPPTLLSFTTSGLPCCLSPGRNHTLLVGDTFGNIQVLSIVPGKK